MQVIKTQGILLNHAPFQSQIRNISWRGKTRLGFGKDILPVQTVKSSVEELLQRQRGLSFLAPVLSKVCGTPIAPTEIGKDLMIDLFQEGEDAVIAEVFSLLADLGAKSFILNISKKPEENERSKRIFENMLYCYRKNPKYMVRPLLLRDGIYDGDRLAIFATEAKSDYIEVNMIKDNKGERKLILNKRGEYIGDLDDQTAVRVAEEMVKTIFLYADGITGRHISHVGINSGDFIYKEGVDPMLYLVTARDIGEFPVWPNEPAVSLVYLMDNLLRQQEYSIFMPQNLSPEQEKLYAIHVFTLEEVLGGLKRALDEIYNNEEKSSLELLKCIAFWQWSVINNPELLLFGHPNYENATLRILAFLEKSGFDVISAGLAIKRMRDQLATLM